MAATVMPDTSSGTDSLAAPTRASASTLLALHHQAEGWRQIAEDAIAVDPASLRKRTRRCALLHQAASRPPTVGVFGESQVGKSFLISRLTGSPAGIVVQDPTAQPGTAPQPWTEESKKFGGLQFIEWINAQTGLEATAMVCRFTRHPVDLPRQPGMFVARLMNHEDLMAALSIGFLSEVPSDAQYEDLIDRLTSLVDQIRSESGTNGDRERLIDLEAAWRFVHAQHEADLYVTALKDAGFPLLLDELIKTRRTPQGALWTKLAGLLWGGGRNPILDEMYQRLDAKLADFNGASTVEIPVSEVIKHGQRPLTDVSLLDDLFTEKSSVLVWAQKSDGVSRVSMTRPELSALVLELVLPVIRDANDPYKLLDHADVLDFPGARADTRYHSANPSDKAAALATALAILRRGKLSRVFATLSERREINVLCLAAKAGNLEAAASITRLLRHWFANQSVSLRPDLFVVLTQCDLTLKAYPTAKWQPDTGGFGELVDEVKRKYASEAASFSWMDQFPPEGKAFTNVHFIYNPAMVPENTVWHGTADITKHVLADSVLRRHVAAVSDKLTALVSGDGGVGHLAAEVLEAIIKHGKFQRLAAEARTMRDELVSTLEPHFADPARAAGRADPTGEAIHDVDAIVHACSSAMENRSPRNPLAVLLEGMRLSERVLRNELRKLERSHSSEPANSPVALSRSHFVEAISKAWTRGIAAKFADESFQTDLLSLGLANATLQSMLRGWTNAVTQKWMHDAMAAALDPYFTVAVGPSNVRDGLLNAAQWAWNRQLVALGTELPPPQTVPLPPRLSDLAQPHWHWLTEHWRRVLPAVYSGGRPPAPWNADLGSLLTALRGLEIPA